MLTRHKAREITSGLLFEYSFDTERIPAEIYETAMREREFEDDKYIRETFFGTLEKLPQIDTVIGEHAQGWKTDRISPVAMAVMRLCIYEMLFAGLDYSIAINEAVELIKEYDDESARTFVNGILDKAAEEGNLKAGKAKTEKK